MEGQDNLNDEKVEKPETQITQLPDELFVMIFKAPVLTCVDIWNCSRICKRWKDIILHFGEKFWEERCAKDYADIYQDSSRKSGLKWEALSYTLARWSDVADATVSVQQIQCKTRFFNLLKDGVVSFPLKFRQNFFNLNPFNAVSYYNVNEMNHLNNLDVDVCFQDYYENDDIIVVGCITNAEEKDGSVRVIPKFDMSKIREDGPTYAQRPWFVHENDVFYQLKTRNRSVFEFCRVRAHFVVGPRVIYQKNVLTDELLGSVEGVKSIDVDEVTILTNNGGRMSISKVKNEVIEFISYVDHTSDPLVKLREAGLDWHDSQIFDWLTSDSSYKQKFNKQDLVSPLCYGQYVIAGTRKSPLKINIYYNPYDEHNNLDLNNAVPIKSIDIEEFKEMNDELEAFNNDNVLYNYIEKIDVLETLDGHKLIVLYCFKILVIALTHEHRKRG